MSSDGPTEERLKAALDAAADAVVVTDRSGSIVAFNHAAERLAGTAAADVMGLALLPLAAERGATGDEFGVILPRTTPEAARTVARTLLEEVRAVGVAVGARTVRVTSSAGLRALGAAEARSAGDLLGEADMAMYDAKERGCDRLLGKETVAEFVEDAETVALLRTIGVDRAQGFHVGRPRLAAIRPTFDPVGSGGLGGVRPVDAR